MTANSDLPFIPFNRAHIGGKELYYIAEAVLKGELKGDGPFTKQCQGWIESRFGVQRALLTHSCTAALEMASQLLELGPEDEVILPSFTFTSTANAVVLSGAKPVFVDIRADTYNIDETLIAEKISSRTKAIYVVHYAGVGCDMDHILQTAQRYKLALVEDAAHAITSTYRGRPLGTIGDIGTFSFHETKNFSSGEGGALLLNRAGYASRAEIIAEKGTNRSQFFRGEVDKYTWVAPGSSYFPSEIIAAFLYGQFERAAEIQARRLAIWSKYYEALLPLQAEQLVQLPAVPTDCVHNAHLFSLLLPTAEQQQRCIEFFRASNIGAVFHYYPLHLSPMGARFGYKAGDLPVTESVASRLVRLPLFFDLSEAEQQRVIDTTLRFFEAKNRV